MLYKLAEKLHTAKSVVLSTHRQCDGDGLGAQIALFYALQKSGKKVRIINLDLPPKKYQFLHGEQFIEIYPDDVNDIEQTDLALILDTNDERLVEPLISQLRKKCKEVLFVDHHPVLKDGPSPTSGSVIDTSAASTGELCFNLLRLLKIALDASIARALYTSLVFDTQLFRFVKSSANSHLMAAELLAFEKEPEFIHRNLFSNYSAKKLNSLFEILQRVEYFENEKIAFVPLTAENLLDTKMDRDESGDVIDQVMNIATIEIAALLREDEPNVCKLSLRSKGTVDVLKIAELFSGGGHRFASGAHILGSFGEIRSRLISEMKRALL